MHSTNELPDEAFVHEPAGELPPFWQESCYFVAHRADRPGDVLILNVISMPSREVFDSYFMTRIDGVLRFQRFTRRYDGDRRGTFAGPVRVEVTRPYEEIQLAGPGLSLTWTARTRAHLLPAGSMTADGRLVWQQHHVIQSGWFNGVHTVNGLARPVRRWWGQRDHSWGVRDHARCPMWMWLAIQLGDGMLGMWHWEHADGSPAYSQGCFAPVGKGDPIAVTAFSHDLAWVGDEALAGTVEVTLADGRHVRVHGSGTWNARYGRRGGGQHHLAVVTDDGRTGTAIYEITGSGHHHFFPGRRR